MKKNILILITTLIFSCSVIEEKSLSEKNLEMAQSFLDNIIANPEKAQNLLHKDFTFAWMGIIEQGGKIWNRENLFNDYFKNIIPEILPNGIVLKTVDAISDEKGVAIIQEGDAVGKNGEYDNTTTPLAWVIKTINEIDNDLPRTEINEEVRKVVAHYNFFTDHNAPDFNDDDAVQLTWKILELEDQKFNEGERKLGQSKAEKKEEADEKKTEDARVQRIREEECDSDIEFEKEIDEMSDEGRGQYSATLSEQDEKSTEGSVSDSDDEKTVFAHHSDVEKEENETQPLQSQKRRKKDRSMIELQNEARRGSSQGGAAGGAAGGSGSSSWNSLQGVGAGRTDQGGDAGHRQDNWSQNLKPKVLRSPIGSQNWRS